jgi:cyclic pyranopterin phosphate synthase
MKQKKLSHLNSKGQAHMVDVGDKDITAREAVAQATVLLKPETLRLVQEGNIKKGDVFGAARLAGVMAAKKTPELIPLTHPLPLDSVNVEFTMDENKSTVTITATARTTARTGVEMEAMTAASVAALTIYDMCKSAEKGIVISEIKLIRKSGGKSGIWER